MYRISPKNRVHKKRDSAVGENRDRYARDFWRVGTSMWVCVSHDQNLNDHVLIEANRIATAVAVK